MNAIEVPTKYGPLEVTFTGEREIEVYQDLKKVRVSMPRAMVTTPHDKPLRVNGVEYRVRADLAYGEHYSREALVTEWYYVPGEYPSFDREVMHGPFGTWTGDPTDKARSTMRDLCQQAVTIAAKDHPAALVDAEAVRLDAEAEKAEAEAQEAAAKVKAKQNEAHLLRGRAQELRALKFYEVKS